jgi:hypothetical protein
MAAGRGNLITYTPSEQAKHVLYFYRQEYNDFAQQVIDRLFLQEHERLSREDSDDSSTLSGEPDG